MQRTLPPFHVTCRWQTEDDPALWTQCLEWFEKTLGEDASIPVDLGSLTALPLGPVLGDETDERIAQVHVTRDQGDLWFTLAIEPRPPTEPPSEVTRADAICGGRAGLLAFLRATVQGAAPIADYAIDLTVSRAAYDCPLVPRSLSAREDELLGNLGQRAHREQVGFRFESGTLGLEEVVIVYIHEPDELLLRIAGRNPLKLGEDRWLPLADDLLELVFMRAFKALEP